MILLYNTSILKHFQVYLENMVTFDNYSYDISTKSEHWKMQSCIKEKNHLDSIDANVYMNIIIV